MNGREKRTKEEEKKSINKQTTQKSILNDYIVMSEQLNE